MTALQLTPDDLLAGSAVTYEIVIPRHILYPGENGQTAAAETEAEQVIYLRPVTIGTFQLIMKAARNDAGLIPLLLIKESLAQPALTLEQIKRLHLGLINFLIAHIREISGLAEKKSPSQD